MQIHASNISGLGATQVVVSLLKAARNQNTLRNYKIIISKNLKDIILFQKINNVKLYKRFLPNSVSRLIECLLSNYIFQNIPTIVLGDIPLRGITNQVVLVHQPNLIYPKINKFSSKKISFRISRFLFNINNKYAKKIIVQTGSMANNLIKSYPEIKDKVIVCTQPVPSWLKKLPPPQNKKNKKIILFYPSAFYPHKRHDFLLKVNSFTKKKRINLDNIEVWVTLSDTNYAQFKGIEWIKNLGKLNSSQMNDIYSKTDYLIFLSSIESYGLPLVEAIFLDIPIITVDFPYSRWLCEDKALYFQPYDEISFLEVIMKHVLKKKPYGKTDYKSLKSKFTSSWDQVFSVFEYHLKNS